MTSTATVRAADYPALLSRLAEQGAVVDRVKVVKIGMGEGYEVSYRHERATLPLDESDGINGHSDGKSHATATQEAGMGQGI